MTGVQTCALPISELAQKRMEKDNYEREYRESEAKLAEVSRRKDEEIRKNQENKRT